MDKTQESPFRTAFSSLSSRKRMIAHQTRTESTSLTPHTSLWRIMEYHEGYMKRRKSSLCHHDVFSSCKDSEMDNSTEQ